MKLRKGRARYRVPEHSQVFHVRIEGNQPHNQMVSIMLQVVDICDIPNPAKRKGEKQEVPRVCAIFDNQIEFYPIPDKAYVAKMQYAPPICEY